MMKTMLQQLIYDHDEVRLFQAVTRLFSLIIFIKDDNEIEFRFTEPVLPSLETLAEMLDRDHFKPFCVHITERR